MDTLRLLKLLPLVENFQVPFELSRATTAIPVLSMVETASPLLVVGSSRMVVSKIPSNSLTSFASVSIIPLLCSSSQSPPLSMFPVTSSDPATSADVSSANFSMKAFPSPVAAMLQP